MKLICIPKFILVAAAAASISSSAYALSYTFDTWGQGAAFAEWSSTYQALQATNDGGWTLGSGPYINIGWPEQTEVAAMANAGGGTVSFDLSTQLDSWPNDTGTWFQFHFAANSDGSTSWTEVGGNLVDGWRNAGEPGTWQGVNQWTFTFSFADVGWEAGDTWFQLWWGANSDADKPVHFYIDNVNINPVPEPSTFALAGLGALALLLARRRK